MKIKVLLPFLSDEKIGGHLDPLTKLIFFPKSANPNFEIAILFNVVEKPHNFVFQDDLIPYSPRGRGCNVQTTYNNGYWEVYRRFKGDFCALTGRGLGRGVKWEDLSMEKYIMREENFYEGAAGFSSIIKKKHWENK